METELLLMQSPPPGIPPLLSKASETVFFFFLLIGGNGAPKNSWLFILSCLILPRLTSRLWHGAPFKVRGIPFGLSSPFSPSNPSPVLLPAQVFPLPFSATTSVQNVDRPLVCPFSSRPLFSTFMGLSELFLLLHRIQVFFFARTELTFSFSQACNLRPFLALPFRKRNFPPLSLRGYTVLLPLRFSSAMRASLFPSLLANYRISPFS